MKNTILIFFLVILTGCASITESKNQSMSVSTGDVVGAMCTLSNSKGSYYVNSTPGSVMVRNACDQLTVSCQKDGYVPANAAAGSIQDKSKGMAWGNIIFGGIIGLLVAGSSLNIYSQIGLIILIGLSAKNGILIVEFANQLRSEGKEIEKAILEAAKIRLRPILMTSLSTIAGVTPLIIGSGPGEASRLTVGVVIFSGMIFSTFFTLYVIPTIYLIIGKNTKRINAVEIELEKQLGSTK